MDKKTGHTAGHPQVTAAHHPGGVPYGVAAEGHDGHPGVHIGAMGHPGSGPSAMKERFGTMQVHNPGLFTIRRLDSRSSPTDSPAPPIRTEIHCFVYVESGETLVTIGNETHLFKARECGIIPAGQVFSVRYWNDCSGYMGGFHTDFLTADCNTRSVMRSFPLLRKWGGHKVHFDTRQAPFISTILRRLEGENSSGGSKEIIRTYLTAFLVEIEQARSKEEGPETDTDNKLCNDFVEYIFENPSSDHSVTFHASRLNVSPSHLSRTVKRLTGKSPQVWINQAVVLEAKVLLEHTDLPVGEISERVGHGDPSYFSRLFRKCVGLTPLAYRSGAKNPKI